MSQNWTGSPTGDSGAYSSNEGWDFPAQVYQQNLNEAAAAALNEDPFHQSATPDDFEAAAVALNKIPSHQPDVLDGLGGFQGDLQYDGQVSVGDAQDDGQAKLASHKDDQDDDPAYHEDRYEEEASDEDVKYEVESDQGNRHQQALDIMIAEGFYKGLLPTQADYHKENRVNKELWELKRLGAVGPDLDDVSMQYWIGRLFMAFKNVNDIKDKPCKNGKPAQSARRLGGDYYPDMAIEMACWRIVIDCSTAHYGVQLVEPHHGTKVEKYDSFAHRMEKIVDVCKTSKATCKQLLDPPYHRRLIDAPENEASVKENNKRLNSKRDVQNIIGRQTMKEKNIKFEDLLGANSDLDEAYESENEDGDNVYYTTPTSTRKRTPASKRRSTSGRTPSRKLDFSSPVETTPLSLKRKRRAVTSKSYKEEEDDESEDTDISEYKDEGEATGGKGSAKRPATSRVMAASPTPTRPRAAPRKQYAEKLPDTHPARTQSQDGLQSAFGDQAHASGSESHDQLLGSNSEPSGQHQRSLSSGSHSQLHSVTSSQSSVTKKPYTIPGPADDNADEGKMEYKFILCDLLQVDRQLAQIYTLQEFRTYARAYNLQFASKPWEMTTHDGGKHTCMMFRIRLPNGTYIAHFCFFLFKLAHLAVGRGDLKSDATFNHHSPHIAGFSTGGDARLDMALGVIPNPFGMVHPQLLDANHYEGYAGYE